MEEATENSHKRNGGGIGADPEEESTDKFHEDPIWDHNRKDRRATGIKAAKSKLWANTNRNIYANCYKDTSHRFTGFLRLMRLWRGSVIKLLWHDLLLFLVFFISLTLLYRLILFHDPVHKERFELICIWSSRYVVQRDDIDKVTKIISPSLCRFRNLIPVTFLTGFYVSQVVTRYWDQFMSLPFTDRLALKLVSFMPGQVLRTFTSQREELS